MKIEFGINKELEVSNIYHCVNTLSYGQSFRTKIDPKIIEQVENRSLEDTRDIITTYIDEYYAKNADMIVQRIHDLEKVWSLVSKKIEERVLKVTGKPFPHERIHVFLTLSSRCNYNYKELWFKVPITSNILLVPTTILHELLHFHYYYYYVNQVLKELNQEESEDLKESLTFIINLEFSDIVTSSDRGYPLHSQIREALATFWNNHKDYDTLVEEGIKIMVSRRQKNG